MKINQAGVTGG